MPIQKTSIHCQYCNQPRLHSREEPNHILHLLATVFLCGLWLPIWILIAITHNAPYRCTQCGVANSFPKMPTRKVANTTTNWQPFLIVGGIVAGVIGLLIIVNVAIQNYNKEQTSQIIQATPNPQLLDIRRIFGQTEKDLDEKFGKPIGISKGTKKGETLRRYSLGKQLIIGMKQGKAIGATFYIDNGQSTYRDALQIVGIDTPVVPDETTTVNGSQTKIWNGLLLGQGTYNIVVSSSGDRYNVVMVELVE